MDKLSLCALVWSCPLLVTKTTWLPKGMTIVCHATISKVLIDVTCRSTLSIILHKAGDTKRKACLTHLRDWQIPNLAQDLVVPLKVGATRAWYDQDLLYCHEAKSLTCYGISKGWSRATHRQGCCIPMGTKCSGNSTSRCTIAPNGIHQPIRQD